MVSKLLLTTCLLLLFTISTLVANNNSLALGRIETDPLKISGQGRKVIKPIQNKFRKEDSNPTNVLGKSSSRSYPIHHNIIATYFWVGEAAGPDNDFISNTQSAWDIQWVQRFGGVDDPKNRKGYFPAAFTPKENPFYFALPYGDYDEFGLKDNSTKIYWYSKVGTNKSLLKNRWAKISSNGRTCYAQWEDVGPNEDNDLSYVFGSSKPKNTWGAKAGIDVSPAVRDCLKGGEVFKVSWQFVEANQVPSGPWKQIITKSDPNW